MPTVKTAAADIEYMVDGVGPALVLVHGTGGNAETNWGHLIPQLSEQHQVIRPNYSGSGGTTDDGKALSVERLALEVLAAADAAGAGIFDLVGFSLGGSIAAFIAGRFPERVRRLVLLAGFSSSGDTRLQMQFELWNRLIETDRRAAAQLILLTGFSPSFLSGLTGEQIETSIDEIVGGNNWEGMKRQVDVDLTLDVTAEVRRIASPTLVIGCTHDHMVAPSHSRELHGSIKRATYLELASGHLAPLEVPDQFVDAILQFLSQTGA